MFNVGDVVTGKAHVPYSITTNKAVMEVVEIHPSNGIILLKILIHTEYPSEVGSRYWVSPEHFIPCNASMPTATETEKEEPLKIKEIPPYVYPTETIEYVRRNMSDLLTQYGHKNAPKGIETILSTYMVNKAPITGILSQHPNWDEKNLAIVFSQDYKRSIDKNEIDNFGAWISSRYEGKLAKESPLKYRGKTFEEWDREYWNASSRELEGEASDAKHTIYRVGVACGGTYVSRQVYQEAAKMNSLFVYIMNYDYNSEGERIYPVLDSLDEGKINEVIAEKINSLFPELKAVKGQKLSRIIGKLGKITGLDKIKEINPANGRDYGWNRRYAMFADAVSPLAITRYTVISVNPLDYLTASFGHNWASCHTIDYQNLRQIDGGHVYHGMYMSGDLSYMLDKVSVVLCTVDGSYKGTEFWKQDKMQRCMFHFGEDKLVQGRVYPDGRDGGDESYAGQFRAVMQKVLAECLNIDNLWVKLKRDNMRSLTSSRGTHYRDYLEYRDPTISKIKGTENTQRIIIGHTPICPTCGREHSAEGSLNCDNCNTVYTCEECGETIDDIGDMISINGYHFCCEECANNYGYVYTMNGGWQPTDDCIQDDYTDEWWYRYEDTYITTSNGYHFINEENAQRAGYVYVEDECEWVRGTNAHVCPICNTCVSDSSWDAEMGMCNDCADEAREEREGA